MNQAHTIPARSATWTERLLCRVRVALQRRRDRAELAKLSAYDLRDVGLSHVAAVPAREACCS